MVSDTGFKEELLVTLINICLTRNVNVAKESMQSFQEWSKLNFEKKNCWSSSALVFLKSLCTRFSISQYLSKSLWSGKQDKVEKGLLVISLHSW
jgi:hypothetical protein